MKVIINGVFGNMGKVLTDIIRKKPDIEISAGIDIAEPALKPPFPYYTSIFDCHENADVIIDSSTADAADMVLDYAVSKKIPLIICTTGLHEPTEKRITEVSEIIPVFKSANMSVGVSLMSILLEKLSKTLYDLDFDIEIIETHHNQKVDAPSGTALMLADSVRSSIETPMNPVFDRTRTRSKREHSEIGIHSVRGGTIVGKHTVMFAGRDETIELTHSSSSKEIYAVGAVSAAEFLVGKPPSLYNMKDMFAHLLDGDI